MADKDKIIERLKKLFALGQSENQHEAELAMAKANDIMTEYQIGMTEIDLSDDGEITREMVEMTEGNGSRWLCCLGNACARLYDGRCLYMKHPKGLKGMTLIFYGTPADILAARMTFNHLHGSWKSIVKHDVRQSQPSDVRGYRRSHGIGFSASIEKRVDELVTARQGKVRAATGRDLVVVKGAALEAFFADKEVTRARINVADGSSGFSAGLKAGHGVPLHGAITPTEMAALPLHGAP